eukprot:3727880-Pyramimonas_sp.AAC.1
MVRACTGRRALVRSTSRRFPVLGRRFCQVSARWDGGRSACDYVPDWRPWSTASRGGRQQRRRICAR